MDNDELQEGQTGTLKKPYLGYRHVEFVEYGLSAGSRADQLRSRNQRMGR